MGTPTPEPETPADGGTTPPPAAGM
jgi:hypothetical protein